MSSTRVHLAPDLLKLLDRAARQRQISRNRLITEACRSIVSAGGAAWPPDLFAQNRLSQDELALLRSSFDDWQPTITAQRHSKRKAPF